MRCTSNFRIKINRSNFLNFFIVPPPPITGRDEPNNTSMALTFFIIAQKNTLTLKKAQAKPFLGLSPY